MVSLATALSQCLPAVKTAFVPGNPEAKFLAEANFAEKQPQILRLRLRMTTLVVRAADGEAGSRSAPGRNPNNRQAKFRKSLCYSGISAVSLFPSVSKDPGGT
jgi:hypothetical protein